MKSCPTMIDVGRRKFLTGAGVAAAGVAASTPCNVPTAAATPPVWLASNYPSNRLANVRDLKPNEPLNGGLSGRRRAWRADQAR